MLLGVSCQQTPDTADLVKFMTVETEYDPALVNGSANIFNTYTTVAMKVDTIGFVSTLSSDTILLESDVPGFVKPVTRRVRDGFLDAGFTIVASDDNPDFAINVVVLENFSFFQSVNYSGYYPGSGYYGYYGYYYPVVTNYYSNFVTLVIQVVDVANYDVNDGYRVVWTAFVGDLNATLDLNGKTLEAVESAFDQSPYISAN
jgi:hypothetical protein